MKNIGKKYIFVFCFLFLLAIMPAIILFNENRGGYAIDCSSDIEVVRGLDIMHLYVNNNFKKNIAIITLSGYLNDKNNTINIKKIFNYHKDGDSYLFYNESASTEIDTKIDINVLVEFIPPFFLYNDSGKNFPMRIKKLFKNKFEFSVADTPYLICES